MTTLENTPYNETQTNLNLLSQIIPNHQLLLEVSKDPNLYITTSTTTTFFIYHNTNITQNITYYFLGDVNLTHELILLTGNKSYYIYFIKRIIINSTIDPNILHLNIINHPYLKSYLLSNKINPQEQIQNFYLL